MLQIELVSKRVDELVVSMRFDLEALYRPKCKIAVQNKPRSQLALS